MIKINSILFTDEFTGTYAGGSDTGVNRLMGCVGDLIYCTIDLFVQWSTLDTNIDFNSTYHTITRKDCSINIGSFLSDGFKVGDTIVITGSSTNDGTYTITDVSKAVITVKENLNNASDTGVNIYGTTTVNYFDFYYNLLGTNDQSSFLSLTDNKSTQKFSGVANPYYYGAQFSLKPNSTSTAWWCNKVSTVDCVPVFTDLGLTSDYKQHFKVVFPFMISPLFKSEQLQILQNSYAQSKGTLLNTVDFDVASYFDENSCLKFVYQIDAKFKVTNRDVDHTSTPQGITGNTSWYNTFFPSGVYLNGNFITKQQYDFVSVAYTDNSGNTLDSIDIANVTNVAVKMKRVGTDTISNLKFVVNFVWLPTDQTKYQGYSQSNQADLRQVFLHDRCKTHIGAGASNGDQYGTSIQAITNCTGTALDSDNFVVDFQINLGSLSKSTLEADSDQRRNYLIFITPQSTASNEIDNSNRSAVLCDVNQAFLDTDDATLLTVTTNGTTDTLYYKYPDTTVNGTTNYKAFVGDYGLLKNNFIVKSGCIIENITITTEALWVEKKTQNIVTSMILDTWANTTSQYYNGVFTDFSLNTKNGYLLPNNDPRNNRNVSRTPNMDVSGYYSYAISFGFQLNNQFWQNITSFPEQFSQFHANYWAVYTQQGFGAGNSKAYINVPQEYLIQLAHKITWNITDPTTGITTEFEQYSFIYAYDDYSNQSGNTIRIDTQNEFGESLAGVVASDTVTNVIAYVDGNVTIPDGYTDIIGELAVYYQDGNKSVYDSITTIDSSVNSGSVWTDIPTIVYNDTYTSAVIQGNLDFSNKTSQVRNIILYAKISYLQDNGLVTTTTLLQIQTDSGTDITPTTK